MTEQDDRAWSVADITGPLIVVDTATTQRMPDLAVGGHAEIETTNTHSMRTMLGREAKERGWVITTRTIANGLRVHRIK